MTGKKFYTNYPFAELGDAPRKYTPKREVVVRSYDGNKYCKVAVLSAGKWVEATTEVKYGYIYNAEWPDGISIDELKKLIGCTCWLSAPTAYCMVHGRTFPKQ